MLNNDKEIIGRHRKNIKNIKKEPLNRGYWSTTVVQNCFSLQKEMYHCVSFHYNQFPWRLHSLQIQLTLCYCLALKNQIKSQDPLLYI